MITENTSTLKINKLSKKQYEREYNAGNIDPMSFYLVPDDEGSSFGSKDFPIELLLENWVLDESTNTYTQTVSVLGLEEDSNPIIVLGSTEDEALDAYNCLTSDVVVADNTITFTAKELPTVTFTVIAKSSGGSSSGGVVDEELVAKVDELETDVVTIDGKVGTLETKTATIETDVNNLETNVTTIDGKVDANTADIATNTSAISQLISDKANFETVGNVSFVRATEQVNITNMENTKMIKLYADDFLIPDLGSVRGLYSDINANLGYIPLFGTTKGAGALTNPLAIDVSNPASNKTAYVYSGHSSNIPSDCLSAIREVYFYNASSITVKLTGEDVNRRGAVWLNRFNGNNWSGWDKQITNSELSTLTEGTFTANSNLEAYTENIRVVRNNVTKLCTVSGDVKLGSSAITAGTMFNLGAINFVPINDVYGLFGSFTGTNKINTTSGSNLVEISLAKNQHLYACVPYAKASGTQGHIIPFYFSFYTE